MIADASVLILLARAGRLDVLHELFGTLEVADVVHAELLAKGERAPGVAAIELAFEAGWLKIEAVHAEHVDTLAARFANLGRGERASLALALARGAPQVLLDDRAARRAAKVLGLTPVGCLGVLALGHRRGAFKDRSELAAALRDVLAAGLWVSAELVEAFWEHVGGRP